VVFYSNGSSSTYGFDLVKPKGYLGTKDEYRLNNCYSGIISNYFKFSLINAAEPGSPNSSIVRRTIFDINRILKTEAPEDIFVLVAFAPATPTEVYLRKYKRYFNIIFPESHIKGVLQEKEKGKIKYLVPEISHFHDFYINEVLDLNFALESFFLNVEILQSYLSSKQVNFKFLHTAPVISCKILENTLVLNEAGDFSWNQKLIDKYILENKIEVSKYSWIEFNENSIIEYCFQKNLCQKGRTGHIIEDGHQVFALYLMKELENVLKAP
jgi:hypothetical protein